MACRWIYASRHISEHLFVFSINNHQGVSTSEALHQGGYSDSFSGCRTASVLPSPPPPCIARQWAHEQNRHSGRDAAGAWAPVAESDRLSATTSECPTCQK